MRHETESTRLTVVIMLSITVAVNSMTLVGLLAVSINACEKNTIYIVSGRKMQVKF